MGNLIAQINAADPKILQNFLIILLAFIGGLGGIVGIINGLRPQKRLLGPSPLEVSLSDRFATRDEIKELRDTVEKLRTEIQIIIGKNEERASRLHARMDPLLEAIARIDGQMGAFTASFQSFSEVVRKCTDGNHSHGHKA